ncbi:sigma-70 family RNA polymerase sigma factor [Burkholderia ubonensis]|uniref:RNA polymerase subunit sigma n=1 Tax=Burkholderia ubonensis TaxID=101571 RepID=A0AAW3MNI7_9BURK|nr:sigma-70 family RNA polymerase sigma factor [Burkholderia ubonensis]KVL22384.1 RNA polymerase subunit sigma [Burkholderia ubonensis]KVN83739.1 RNA polymerase subunit sigma [Burkholderia ubonensis]KVP87042.1 RNA polymerase subunit sigma [Burkholderia ubonensis]KVQ37890.1 RNA polymerase subunit sigma [Burkholderia ubonensis]KVU54153.1 RNA polymerase subunit sigma [Burkholderia ubonensis]
MTAAQLALHQDVHTLYRDHHGWLQGWLRRRLGNAVDAADLAHDAFLRLILKPASKGFDGPAEARAYLRTMAQGMCIDLFRRRQVEQAWLDSLAALPEPCEPSPEYRAIIIETLMEVGEFISRLPEKARKAFIMAQIHGLPSREIAGELAVSERMVQKYLAQAMLHLALLDAGLTH